MLNAYIMKFEPDYNKNQIDLLPNEHSYVFSISGTCELNTQQKEILPFILSLKINLNANYNNGEIQIEEILMIDYIKLKIISN